MTKETKPEFSKLRAFIWPVHAYELKKVLPMFLLFFCISFNYTILRDTKDTLVATSKAGAEAIPFLKFWGVMPAAVIFMLIYSKLSNTLSKPALFYTTMMPFLIFFSLFSTLVYPNLDALRFDSFANGVNALLPEHLVTGLHGLIESVRMWPYSIFYILSELWGSVVLSLLFWGFANEITKVAEAKRVYAIFSMGANLALIFSGGAIRYVSMLRKEAAVNIDAWQVSLNYLMGMAAVACLVIIGLYWWLNKYVLTDTRFYDPSEMQPKKKKLKMSIGDSIKFLVTSPYMLLLAALVICYGISINIVEVTWKKHLALEFPNPNDYSAFMGRFSQITGITTFLMLLLVSGNLLRRKGWGFTALVTPIVLLITGAGFFFFVLGKEALEPFCANVLSATPLWIAVLFGAAQNIMSKSSKYALFDPTKEMAYIPLDSESKVKGKAAVDVVGARLGKSGGSLIQQMLLILLGTNLFGITPYLGGILLAIIIVWVIAVKKLEKRFSAKQAEKEQASA